MMIRNKYIDNVVNSIILKYSEMNNLSVIDGRMAIVIFLYHYSRLYNLSVYHDLSNLLLNDVFEDICDTTPIFFKDGLLGISWGVEYLIKERFVDGDSYEILEEIDNKIVTLNVSRVIDTSLYNGIEGLFQYVLFHLPVRKDMKCPFDDDFLQDLDNYVITKHILNENTDLDILVAKYHDWRQGSDLQYSFEKILKLILKSTNLLFDR